MKLKPVFLAAAMMVALPVMAQSQLTVVNFGGANGAAQKKAYFEAYEKAGGGKITAVEYNGEQAKIKAMVEAKKVTWDVVEVESPDLSRGCDEGLFEKLDWAKIGNKADFQKAAVHECGVGTFVWSTVMAYDGDKLKTAPTTWADFWDTKKFPGKRGLRKGAKYTLEFALMADGVAPADGLPAEDELRSLGFGGGLRQAPIDTRPVAPTIEISIRHGDLSYARHPVLVGHYLGDTVVSAEATLDRQLGHALSRRLELGLARGRQSGYLEMR